MQHAACVRRSALLVGVSLLAMGAVMVSAPAAYATGTCAAASPGGPVVCSWSAGDYVVNSTDTIAGLGVFQGYTGITASGSTALGTLTNNGTIRNLNYAILNNNTVGVSEVINSGNLYDIGTFFVNNGRVSIVDNKSSIDGNYGTSGVVSNGVMNNSGGYIGSVINESTISTNFVGIYNKGEIESINNQGTLGGSFAAVFNESGSIGTLTNNGVISIIGGQGDARGIYNITENFGASTGTITNLINSGSINVQGSAGYSISGISNLGSISNLENDNTISISGSQLSEGVGIENSSGYSSGIIGNLINRGTISVSATAGTSGYVAGIYNGSAQINTLTNSGTISVDNSAGVYNNSGSITTLDNASTGVIHAVTGIYNGQYSNSALVPHGTIGTLTNSGTISGSNFGVNNYYGSITTLTNNRTGTISGGSIGIYNDNGSIGTINNSGLMSGSGYGIDNSGTISALNNTGGTITGAQYTGLRNQSGGTIGALTNSGTISGAANAIQNSGQFGLLTNTGVIAGNIVNDSSNSFSIAGGSGSTYGLLTGYNSGTASLASPGTVGTIDGHSHNTNLVLSGNLLVNDNIDLGTGMVNSTGVIKLVNPISITGSYRQTGGGLIVTASNNGSIYSSLSVSRSATVSGTAIVISGTGLTSGETFSVVRAGSTSSYTNDTATVTGTSGLTATVSQVGNDLVVTLSSGSNSNGNGNGNGNGNSSSNSSSSSPSSSPTYTQVGAVASSSGGAIGSTLDKVASGTSAAAVSFQNTVLSVINALPTSSQGTAIKQLAPTQNVPSSQMSANAATAVLGAVEQHQQTAMSGDTDVVGRSAGSDAQNSALWGQLLGGGSVRGSTAASDGSRTTNFGLATGYDHRFSDNAMAGLALSWLRGLSEGADSSSGSNSTLDSYQLTAYGTYRQGAAFIDGQIGGGYNKFHQNRKIAFLNEIATADYGGEQYLMRAQAGYDIPVNAVKLTPLAGLTWVRSVNDEYAETGAGNADLTVDRRGVNSLSQDLGGKVSWSVVTDFGVLKPEVRVEWVHDYTQSAIGTSGLLAGTTYAVTSARTSPDGIQVGLAATLSSDDDLSFRVEYEGEARAKYQSHVGMVKAVWGF